MARNVDHKGRRVEPRHVRLYHTVTGCEAWRDLSGNAVKVLIALLRYDRGGDNGALFMSARAAGLEAGLSKNTANTALRELEEHGFIASTEIGHFHSGGGKATQWRVTWQAVKGVEGVPNMPPTRGFERWTKPVGNKTPSQNLIAPVPKIGTDMETRALPVPKIGTGSTETSGVSRGGPVPEIGTQVVCHGQCVSEGGNEHWKHSNTSSGVSTDLIGDELLAALRERLAVHLSVAGLGAQSRLSEAARIPGGTLSKFMAGKGLSRTHFVSLQLELNRALREAA